jgi:thiol:disulfide interchange protein
MKRNLLTAILIAFSLSLTVAMASEPMKTQSSEIQWLTSMDQAIKRAQAENKPILLDFFNPN